MFETSWAEMGQTQVKLANVILVVVEVVAEAEASLQGRLPSLLVQHCQNPTRTPPTQAMPPPREKITSPSLSKTNSSNRKAYWLV